MQEGFSWTDLPFLLFWGGLSFHPGQHAAKHREAAACWGRHSHHVSMCPHGDTDHRGCEGDKDPITSLVPSTIFE